VLIFAILQLAVFQFVHIRFSGRTISLQDSCSVFSDLLPGPSLLSGFDACYVSDAFFSPVSSFWEGTEKGERGGEREEAH
jgi:hypothetical protein